MFDKIANFLSSGLFSGITELVKDYFPPDLSAAEKMELELKMREWAHEKELELQRLTNEATNLLNERIAQQEGTAKDLKGVPVLGTLILFLRGMQRPIWGFFTIYLDYSWFTTAVVYTDKQEGGLILINILVLGFLFGERTILNLQPLIEKIFSTKVTK